MDGAAVGASEHAAPALVQQHTHAHARTHGRCYKPAPTILQTNPGSPLLRPRIPESLLWARARRWEQGLATEGPVRKE